MNECVCRDGVHIYIYVCVVCIVAWICMCAYKYIYDVYVVFVCGVYVECVCMFIGVECIHMLYEMCV